jgi:hypothetical protein
MVLREKIASAQSSLSARSGERAGPIAQRWEGEVVDRMRSTRREIALVAAVPNNREEPSWRG